MTPRAGFTLTEVLIAVSILTGALAGAAMLLTSAFGTFRHQNQSMEVSHVVHDQLELLTATPYQQLDADIKSARRPEDPVRPGAGAKDFVLTATGDVTAKFDLEPSEKDPNVYTLKPHQAGNPDILQVSSNFKTSPNHLEATMRLQWWDPTFDTPSMLDKGLIRASIIVKGAGTKDNGVKYLTR